MADTGNEKLKTAFICRDIEKCTDGSDHDFSGWRPFSDGNGGEQVCKKCGVGAMTWSLRVGP